MASHICQFILMFCMSNPQLTEVKEQLQSEVQMLLHFQGHSMLPHSPERLHCLYIKSMKPPFKEATQSLKMFVNTIPLLRPQAWHQYTHHQAWQEMATHFPVLSADLVIILAHLIRQPQHGTKNRPPEQSQDSIPVPEFCLESQSVHLDLALVAQMITMMYLRNFTERKPNIRHSLLRLKMIIYLL